MAFDVRQFTALVDKAGLLRPTKFEVEVPVPRALSDSNVAGREASVGAARQMRFFAESTALPGLQLFTSESKRYGYGPVEKKPYSAVFTEVPMVVRADGSGAVIEFLRNWQKVAVNYHVRDEDMNSMTGVLPQQTPFEVAYKLDYAVPVTITVFGDDGNVADVVVLREAFPTVVSEVGLSWAGKNEYMRVGVTLCFWDWYSRKVPTVHKTNLPQQTPISVKG